MRVEKILLLPIFLLLLLFVVLDAALFVSYWWGYLSIALFFCSCLCLAYCDRQFFWLSFYFLFSLSVALVCLVFVEHGAYMWEIRRYGEQTGVMTRSALYAFLAIIGAYYAYLMVQRLGISFYNIKRGQECVVWGVVRGLVVVFGVVLLVIAFIYGTPRDYGVHRQDFWTYYAPGWGGAINYWLIQMSFPLGYFYAIRKKKLDASLFGLVLLVVVFMGERYTGIVLCFFFFFLPLLVRSKVSPFRVFFDLRSFALLALLTLLVSFFIFQSYFVVGQGVAEAANSIAGRAVLQAQMWWALDQLSSLHPKSFGEIFQGLVGIGFDENESGVYHLMRLVAPQDVVDYRIETGSAFTMSGVFNVVYYFGYVLGAGASLLYGAVFGLCCAILRASLSALNVLAAVFSFKFMFKVLVVLLSGKTPLLFTFGTFSFFMLAAIFVKFSKWSNR